jgi:hypothetical protein
VNARPEPFAMIPFSLFECCQDFNALHLYAWLRRHANKEGIATTGTEKLAREMGTSRRAFQRALTELRSTGFVRTKRRHRDDGSVAGLTFTVFDSRQSARIGAMDQSAKSGAMVTGQSASFRPAKAPDLAHLKEVDLLYVDLNALKAGAGAPIPPVENPDAPTEATLWTLLKSIVQDDGFTDMANLNASYRARAARLFAYDADVQLLNHTFNKFVAAYGRGDLRLGRKAR